MKLKLERFDYLVWETVTVIALAIGGVVLLGDRVGSQLTATIPADGGEIGGGGRVGIQFAQAMRVETVAPLFSIEPATEGVIEWDGDTMWFKPIRALSPDTQFTARLKAGALSAEGREMKNEVAWRFSVRQPRLIYVASTDKRDLWVTTIGGTPKQLTQTEGSVYDYAVSPNGEQIVYSVINEASGIDLWVMTDAGESARKLLDCGPERCLVPAWSPDGKRLAYSRQSAGLTPGGPLGPPRVWILELSNDQTGQLYENDQVLGWGPTWSPDGNWIAAYDGTSTRIRVLNVQTKKEILLPSLMGTTGSWSPDGKRMLYNDLKIAGEQTHATLYLADFATEEISSAFTDDPADVNYGIPNWSPDGAWVVTGIKRADQGLGSQLWIMRPDGSEARPITDDLAYTFGGYSWDRWGELVVFQRFELGVPFAKPEVMVWSFATGQITPIVQDASLPGWLP